MMSSHHQYFQILKIPRYFFLITLYQLLRFIQFKHRRINIVLLLIFQNLTDDGDEPEKNQVFHSLENKDPQEHTDNCLYGEFKTTDGDCVCYEEGTNFIGQTFARADDMETYQECQKLCQSQINCEYWSHYSGDERSNTCLLKNRITALSRASDDPDSVYFVSGTKNCNVPITKGNMTGNTFNLITLFINDIFVLTKLKSKFKTLLF